MAENSIGSVAVDIRGDYSRLGGDFAQAQALAQKAGAGIATGLTSAMGPALKGASALVDQFGRSIVTGIAEPAAAALPPVLDLGAAIDRLAIYQALLAEANELAGQSTTRFGNAAQDASGKVGSLGNQIPLLGRAAERFISLIPGLTELLVAGFPVLGAIALIGNLKQLAGGTDEVTEAQKRLKQTLEQNGEESERLAASFEHINIERFAAQFGALQGMQMKGFVDEGAVKRDKARLEDLGRQIGDLKKRIASDLSFQNAGPVTATLQAFNPLMTSLNYASNQDAKVQLENIKGLESERGKLAAKIAAGDNQLEADKEKRDRTAAQDTGQLRSGQLANQERALSAEAEMAKKVSDFQIAQSHAAVQIRITAMHDADAASIASAQEELRVAQEKERAITAALEAELPKRLALIRAQGEAEKQGKTPVEAARIDVATAGKVQGAEGDAARQTFDAYAATVEKQNKLDEARAGLVKKQALDEQKVWEEFYDAIGKDAKEFQAIQTAAMGKSLATFQRVSEIEAKSAGRTGAEAIQGQKLEMERRYGLEVGHSLAQQIQYEERLAGFDDRARAKQIEGLQNELAVAQGIEDESRQKVEVARIQAEINELQTRGDNAHLAAQIRIDRLRKEQDLGKNLKGDAFNAVHQIPGAAGGALARGLIDGKHIGQDIRDAMKGVGQQLLGQIFRDLIVKIGAEIAAHTILGGIMLWLGGNNSADAAAQVAASGLNTAALHANTIAQLKSIAGGAAGGIAGGAGSASGAAGSAVGAAASGLIGPLIAAAGGIIGGVISGVMSLIGAHAIVAAIHGTTAAVQALHGTVSTGSSGSAPASQGSFASSASQGGLFGFFSSILGFGGSKPMDVNIVSISPLSPLKGLFNLFGFAEGGRPPVGVASIVGERGPELFIPDTAGMIVPNGKFGGAGLQLPSVAGISSSTSSISGGNHTFNIYGGGNPREVARSVAGFLKNSSPQFSPLAR